MTRVAILGATGSIGRQALEVIGAHRDRFTVVGLAANRRVELLGEQAAAFGAKTVVVGPEGDVEAARRTAPPGVRVEGGEEALAELAARDDVDLVVAAMSGVVGLRPVLAAVRAGKRVALANKEPLVVAGEIIVAEAARSGAVLLPVDSEHSAIFQALMGQDRGAVRRVVLTASGGAFRDRPLDQLDSVTPEEALAHPTWRMGPKVTVDSATLMNKGLEVIEARWLFGLALDQIEVVLHPESIVHSLVEFVDGSVLAQLACPDMRIPLQFALTFPEREPAEWGRLDLAQVGKLHFGPLDRQRYPAVELAYAAARAGGTAPAVLNAADEVAVGWFLEGRLRFADIPRLIAVSLEEHTPVAGPTLEQLLAADREVRRRLERSIDTWASSSR